MSEEFEGAILQRDKETYAIVPRIPMGILTPEILEKLAKVARKYNVRNHQDYLGPAYSTHRIQTSRN